MGEEIGEKNGVEQAIPTGVCILSFSMQLMVSVQLEVSLVIIFFLIWLYHHKRLLERVLLSFIPWTLCVFSCHKYKFWFCIFLPTFVLSNLPTDSLIYDDCAVCTEVEGAVTHYQKAESSDSATVWWFLLQSAGAWGKCVR